MAKAIGMWPFRAKHATLALRERVQSYVAEELPLRLGLLAGGVEAAVEPCAHGRAARVHHVTLDGYGPVLLRTFPHRHHRARLAGIQALHNLLLAHDVPASRLLFTDSSAATWHSYGFCVLAEEWLPGRALADLPQDARQPAIPRLGEVLARLHAIRSPIPGRTWDGEMRDPAHWTLHTSRTWLDAIAHAGLGVTHAEAKGLAGWFAEQFRALARDAYPLIHQSPHGYNLLVSPEGRVHLLDFGRSAYWFPQHDLVVAEHWVERLAPGHADVLLDHYFEGANGREPLTRPEYERTRSLFSAWFCLDVAAGHARRLLRGARHGRPATEASAGEARSYWEMAQQSLDAAQAPLPRLSVAALGRTAGLSAQKLSHQR